VELLNATGFAFSLLEVVVAACLPRNWVGIDAMLLPVAPLFLAFLLGIVEVGDSKLVVESWVCCQKR